ncbi:Lsr2 dimerization domain-containing protein [Streptomyces werraensis]|uniref:Lsr2 dimerization domain-containing protein n=1 Tax=Streptomyces werraensis TaxID=68284 RepID=UPI003413CCA8
MALEVIRTDDFDGTNADETVIFSLDGRAYEIELSKANAAAFRRMMAPYLDKARPVTYPKGAIIYVATGLDGTFQVLGPSRETPEQQQQNPPVTPIGHRSLLHTTPPPQRPTLVTATPETDHHSTGHTPSQPASEEPHDADPNVPNPHTGASDPQVRTWAKHWSVPGIPARGRVPGSIRSIYEAFEGGDRTPWKELLEEHGVDIAQAEAQANASIGALSEEDPGPTQDDLDRQAAQKLGNLTSAQVTELRRMYNAPDGRATSNSKTDTSYKALRTRGCCALIYQGDKSATYEITNIGRLWFEVRGIPTQDTSAD